VFGDNQEVIPEQEIQMGGLIVVKRAYRLYQENKFDATLLCAALRGNYHIIELTCANLIISIHP